jgi:hypothetical protein
VFECPRRKITHKINLGKENIMEEDRTVKNAIFSARAAVETAQQPPSQQKELGIEIPVFGIALPSKGLIYGQETPLHNQEFVDIKAMTAKEENILMSRALVRRGTVITELIKSCLIDKSIEVNDMISGDRNALMVAIRVSGYGSDYTPQFKCPECEQMQEFTFKLAELETKELDLEKLNQVEPFKNLFLFQLPASKKNVEFKFITGKEEEQMLQVVEARKKRGMLNDEVITTRLLNSIVSIDGIKERSYISKFANNMLASDSLALRRHIDNNEPSIDMTQSFTCNNCDYSEVMSIPMGPSFLWPRV